MLLLLLLSSSVIIVATDFDSLFKGMLKAKVSSSLSLSFAAPVEEKEESQSVELSFQPIRSCI